MVWWYGEVVRWCGEVVGWWGGGGEVVGEVVG